MTKVFNLYRQENKELAQLFPFISASSFVSGVQGGPSALGKKYVDINYVSFGGHPETDLSQHNPVREQMDHPVDYHGSHRPNKYPPPAFLNL